MGLGEPKYGGTSRRAGDRQVHSGGDGPRGAQKGSHRARRIGAEAGNAPRRTQGPQSRSQSSHRLLRGIVKERERENVCVWKQTLLSCASPPPFPGPRLSTYVASPVAPQFRSPCDPRWPLIPYLFLFGWPLRAAVSSGVSSADASSSPPPVPTLLGETERRDGCESVVVLCVRFPSPPFLKGRRRRRGCVRFLCNMVVVVVFGSFATWSWWWCSVVLSRSSSSSSFSCPARRRRLCVVWCELSLFLRLLSSFSLGLRTCIPVRLPWPMRIFGGDSC